MVSRELNYADAEEFYWSDSTAVLYYINNETRRFKTFVANRTEMVRSLTDVSQWRHVPSQFNPADECSRGINASKFARNHRWFHGPEFLKDDSSTWPVLTNFSTPSDVEICKKSVVLLQQCKEASSLLSRLEKFSSWYRLTLAVAVLLRFLRRAKLTGAGASLNTSGALPPISVEDKQAAENVLFRICQEPYLELWKIGTKSSPLVRLDAFSDGGVIRVGGRIKNSDLQDYVKHPVVLPRESHITTLIIRHLHEKVCHGGRQLTLGEIRSNGFWILHGGVAVRQYIAQCVICRKLRGPEQRQMMADLPKDRVTAGFPPFTYSAVDHFGPFYVKQGRSQVKRYGVLFLCMASRAVHIEVSPKMDTDSFINALRRFLCRRGPVRQIRSDRGTNLVGADRELKRELEAMDDVRIATMLRSQNIVWKYNPPYASHFGGIWERQIRTVRAIFSAMLKDVKVLDDDSFSTLMTEVEAIINSRPLTAVSSCPFSVPLSPSNLLTLRETVIMPPPGVFQSSDLYCRRRWRRVQHLANVFWQRWRREVLLQMQERSKWQRKLPTLRVGDIVLLKDDSTPRNQWSIAKVSETIGHENVRQVKLRLPSGDIALRPISRVVLLLRA
ncbi:Uncharacterised protein at_DN1167 [Pycnogonum litorale]